MEINHKHKVELNDFLRQAIADPRFSFSIGSLGAVAEFFRDQDEPTQITELNGLRIATERGAIGLRIENTVVPIAYEQLSRRRGNWQHGLVFCLPESEVPKRSASIMTEIGPDHEAIRSQDRDAMLFEMGLQTPNVEFFIRTHEPEFIEYLRQFCGRSVLEAGNPVMAEIVKHSPHRVVVSRLGRVEVYVPIPTDKTPQGPHTHVLPKLLKTHRSHATTIPVPRGYLPCLSIYPPHPLQDGVGTHRSFSPRDHRAFEKLLTQWGVAEYRDPKCSALNSLERGVEPEAHEQPRTKLARAATRIALRQLTAGGNDSALVRRWLTAFD